MFSASGLGVLRSCGNDFVYGPLHPEHAKGLFLVGAFPKTCRSDSGQHRGMWRGVDSAVIQSRARLAYSCGLFCRLSRGCLNAVFFFFGQACRLRRSIGSRLTEAEPAACAPHNEMGASWAMSLESAGLYARPRHAVVPRERSAYQHGDLGDVWSRGTAGHHLGPCRAMPFVLISAPTIKQVLFCKKDQGIFCAANRALQLRTFLGLFRNRRRYLRRSPGPAFDMGKTQTAFSRSGP